MNTLVTNRRSSLAINIVSVFLILALLRLLPFNFFASMLVGHEVIIDNKEGNAINFINYISVAFLIFIGLIKLPTLKAKWAELWPFVLLIVIYQINFLMAPYVNFLWVMYQLSFILIAALIHLVLSGQSHQQYETTLQTGGFMVFLFGCFLFLIVVSISIYSQFSVSYVLTEFNDSFVNSVNGFGLMKQYYGYVAGFLLLFTFFMINNNWIKLTVFFLVLLSAFGIRSFVLGIIGVLFFKNIKNPLALFLIISISTLASFLVWDVVILELLYDTRFYAYMNGWDIVQKFPFGVGLGGYPIYTENNNSDLFAAFFNIDAALNYVPNSPESDIVHVFSSLGLGLGLIHFAIQLRLIFLGVRHEIKMSPFEKCMFYYFIFMTAFGISEDTMFTVSYWIFFGITSGIIASVTKRKIHA